MSKITHVLIAMLIAIALTASAQAPTVFAQTVDTPTAPATSTPTIADLLAQIASLKRQVEELRQLITTRAQNAPAAPSTLQLRHELRRGASGDEVRVLQRILATDPTLYPEGLVTGFFGPLTERAVGRLQNKFKLEVRGAVSAETLNLINALLKAQGVTSAAIPADLITSGATKIKIETKNTNGKIEYKIEVKCDSRGKGNQCKDEEKEDDADADTDEEDDDNGDVDDDEEDD